MKSSQVFDFYGIYQICLNLVQIGSRPVFSRLPELYPQAIQQVFHKTCVKPGSGGPAPEKAAWYLKKS
jgi:hypothetical protein